MVSHGDLVIKRRGSGISWRSSNQEERDGISWRSSNQEEREIYIMEI